MSGRGNWLVLIALCLGLFSGCEASSGRPSNSTHGSAVTIGQLTGELAGEAQDGLRGKLVLTGSSTLAPLAVEIGKRFERQHAGVRIDVQTGGSSRGIADVRSGVADFGMASRSLTNDEAGLLTHVLAVDGICLIVHKDNPLSSLTDDQVVGIYTGRIDNWRDVGGVDAHIVVANKAEGRGTLEVFLAHFQLDNNDIVADIIVGENQHAMKTVSGNPLAIAYVSIGGADAEQRGGTAIKLLRANGVAPTAENVASGTFPIARPLLLVTRDEPTGLAREFLRFARSVENNDLIEAHHFVPLNR